MRPPSRENIAPLAVLFILLVVTIFAALQPKFGNQSPPLVANSNTPNGAKAFYLWLQALDYPVSDQRLDQFKPPAATKTILMLEPTIAVDFLEWQTIDTWVNKGGTLIIAADEFPSWPIFQHYEVIIRRLPLADEPPLLQMVTPLLGSPLPLPEQFEAARSVFSITDLNTHPFITHAKIDDQPFILSMEQGKGRVILVASAEIFSNQHLRLPSSSPLALNIINASRTSGPIWFDDWHHGLRKPLPETGEAENGTLYWLRHTPTGQALLYAIAVIFFALLLSGRRLGRVTPIYNNTRRRAPLEYITAIANMNRRAGNQKETLAHYRFRLKRSLGKRYRLNPRLPDDTFIKQLHESNPNITIGPIIDLLRRLNQQPTNEAAFIRLTNEASQLIK